MQAVASELIKPNTIQTRPYPPSFIDRFMDWVEGLPVPYWLTYLVFFIVHVFITHVVSWMVGLLPAFTFDSIALTYPLWLWGPLALMTYLDSTALDALSNFGPLLDIPSETMQRLKYEFTTMPARGVIINELIWIGIYAIYSSLTIPSYVTSGFGTGAIIYAVFDGLVAFLIGNVIFYHTIRQLRLVHRTVKLVKQFDLFRLDPVYAFSVLTSRAGVAWILLPGLTLLFRQVQLVLVIVLLLVGVALALTAFALPLWVVHQHLVEEKRGLLAEHDQRVKSTLAQLHRCLDDNELGELTQLNNALTGLNVEHDMLIKIPTWPWRAGLFTGFLSLIILPMIIFLMQLVIGHWLGR